MICRAALTPEPTAPPAVASEPWAARVVTPASKQIGLYGYLLHNARSLGELLELASHYFNILFHTSKIYFRHGPQQSSFEYRIVTPTTQLQRHDIDWSVGTYIHLIRSFIGQQTNYFEIDNELLSITINDSDPGLLKIIKEQADQLLNSWIEDDSFYHCVRLMIMQGLGEDGFNAEVLARRMGMSISTLKRCLAEYQLSFRMIRDELVDSLGKQTLKDTHLPIGHIAAQLGYSKPAAFDRAFKRLAGMTPREYRKRPFMLS